jgi:hypothetical protein
VDGLANILGYGVSSLLVRYLSLLLGAFYKAKYIWDGGIEHIECWLTSWKRMYLSKGGRVTLINVSLPSPCKCCKPYSTRFLIGWAKRRVQISLGKLVQDLFFDL